MKWHLRYLKVLAVKKTRNDLLSALSESELPVLIRPRDEAQLFGVQKRSFEADLLAEKVHALLYGETGKIDVFIEE